jgi:hypothetical protein
MTSRGLRPSLAPSPEVLPRIPYTPRRDPPNIAPPPIEVADAGAQPVPPSANDIQGPASPASVTSGKAAPAPKPKPKKDFVHGVLGL